MIKRQDIKCPICGRQFFVRENDKLICLTRNDVGEYCKGFLPARRERDKHIPSRAELIRDWQ